MQKDNESTLPPIHVKSPSRVARRCPAGNSQDSPASSVKDSPSHKHHLRDIREATGADASEMRDSVLSLPPIGSAMQLLPHGALGQSSASVRDTEKGSERNESYENQTAGTAKATSMLAGMTNKARKPIKHKLNRWGKLKWMAYEPPLPWYLDIVKRATDVNTVPKAVSLQKVADLQVEFMSELSDMYNECRKSSQTAGGKAQPKTMVVRTDFFCKDPHDLRRSNFYSAKEYLEQKLFHAHHIVIKLHELFHAKCSSLSFFKHLEDDAFPIDEDLFYEIQHAQIRYTSEVLHLQVFVEAQAIFNALPEFRWVGPGMLDSFLLCVKQVMSLHLGKLLFKTLHSVVELFERFDSDTDDSAIFILNLIVNDRGIICYSPEPLETLSRIAQLLEKVRNTICSIPVIQSSLTSIENYNCLTVVSSHEANVMLQEAISQLTIFLKSKMDGPEHLRSQFEAYYFVLAEPYFEFPPNWYEKWKLMVPQWEQIWKRSRTLIDEIEVLAKDEEDVGIFVAITSGPKKYKLVTEMLVRKARSLGDHVKDTVAEYIISKSTELRREYEEAFSLCMDKSVEPQKLVEHIEGLKVIKGKLKRMESQAHDLQALFEVISKHGYLLQDKDALSFFRCTYLASVLPRLEDEARNFLSEKKWIVEDDFKKSRILVSGQLLDFKDHKMQVMCNWKQMHHAEEYLQQISEFEKEVNKLEELVDDVIKKELQVGLQMGPIDLLVEISSNLRTYKSLWTLCKEVPAAVRQLKKQRAKDLNVDRILHSFNEWTTQITGVMNVLDQNGNSYQLATEIKKQLQEVLSLIPVLRLWTNPNMRKRHWALVFHILKQTFDPEHGQILVQSMFSWKISGYSIVSQLKEYNEIVNMEYELEETVLNMQAQWGGCAIPIRALGASGTFYAERIESMLLIVQEAVLKMDSVLKMHHGTQETITKAKNWLETVNYMDLMLTIWSRTQNQYLAVRPVMDSKELRPVLSNEESYVWQRVETLWKANMASVFEEPSLLAVSTQKDLLKNFETIEHDLEFLRKIVDVFVSDVRSEYVRFYFISEADVLRIVTISNENILNIQHHICKIFPGVDSLDIKAVTRGERKIHQIVGLRSSLGETMQLIPIITVGHDERKINSSNTNETRQHLQTWLLQIETVMVESLHRQIDNARKAFEFSDFEQWMHGHTQQSMAIAQSIIYTTKIEDILSDPGNKLKMISGSIAIKNNIIESITETLGSQNSELGRHKCIASSLHNIAERDMLQKILSEEPRSTEDFAWQSQFRYYLDLESSPAQGRIVIHIMQHQYPYGLEYLGNTMPLAWSISLETCYKIVGSALGSYSWAGLAGNASTCTSFMKNLAHSFGTLFFTLPCDVLPSLTVINHLCKGIASSNFWLVFKAVDLVPTYILQTLSTSIVAVQNALRIRASMTSIDGESVKMRLNQGILGDRPPPGFFVTTDRRSNGHNLPNCLLALFRPIVIHTPDIVHVMEVILIANGFQMASTLARKTHFAFQSFREQLPLSKNLFPKFTLMESINNMIKLKVQYPHEREVKLLIKTLLLKAPSIKLDDQQTFYDIVGSLSNEDLASLADSHSLVGKFFFPQHVLQFESNIQFESSKAPASWKNKVLELFSASCHSNGVIAVGQACTGKTSCIEEMADSLARLFAEQESPGLNTLASSVPPTGVDTVFIFPRAFSLDSLYGRIGKTESGREIWVDGMLTAMFRAEAKAQEGTIFSQATFFIMDGQMDSDWCDRLTPVMGMEKHLHLPQFETIPAPKFNTMIFEAEDLSTATPATVSRCRIVYFESTNDCWWQSASLQMEDWHENILNQWIQLEENAFATGKEVFDVLLEDIMKPALHFVASECKEQFTMVSNVHRVWSHLLMFERLCLNALHEQAMESENNQRKYRPCDWLVPNFLFALVSVVGSVLDVKSQVKFDTYLRDLLRNFNSKIRAEKRNGKSTHADFKIASFPSSGSVFEFSYLYTSTRKGWTQWKEMPIASMYAEVSGKSLEDLVIPTTNFIRYNCQLGLAIDSRLSVLMNGPAACGKSLYIRNKMQNYLTHSKFIHSTYNMSPATTVENLHNIFWQKLHANGVGKLAPKGERHLVVFIEDINLASRNKFGTSSTLEYIRNLLNKKSGYSLAMPPVLKSIDRVFLLTTIQHRDSSLTIIPPRLLRHFFVLNVSVGASNEDFRGIFEASLRWYHATQEFPKSITALSDMVVKATIALYDQIQTRLKPTLLCPHYIFSHRDLNAVLSGMMLQTKEDLQQSADSPENEHLRLWAHEVLRVFYDRIKDANDKSWFLDTLKYVIRDHLNQDFNALFQHLDINHDGDIDAEELRRLFFGSYQAGPDFIHKHGEEVGYDEIENPEQIMTLMTSYCQKYDAEHVQPMNLFMTLYSSEHLSRLSRVFQMRQGHALLLGSTGVGRRSLTRMATFMRGAKYSEIHIEPEVDPEGTAWNEHFKKIIRQCGLGLSPSSVILIRDEMLNDERMQFISCILNGSEIFGLYTDEEIVVLVDEMQEHGLIEDTMIQPSLEESYTLFLQMAYDALHLVICVDPKTKNLRDMFQSYPSVATKCYMDWFEDWPTETLQQMAHVHLSELFDPDVVEDPKVGPKVFMICEEMHNTAFEVARSYLLQAKRSYVSITLTDYAFFLKFFSALFRSKREEITSERALLNSACATSEKIKNRVKNALDEEKTMLNEREELTVTSAQKQEEIKSLQIAVSRLKTQVDGISKAIENNQKTQKRTEEQIVVEKTAIEEWMKKASNCLQTITPRDIGKFKSFINMDQTCPECIMDLAYALSAIMVGTLKPSETNEERKLLFPQIKKMVGSPDFKNKLIALSPEASTTDLLVQGASIVRKRFLNKKVHHQEIFTHDHIARTCLGCAKFFIWISAALEFEEKVRNVLAPITEGLEKLRSDHLLMEEERFKLLSEHSESSSMLADATALIEEINARKSVLDEMGSSFREKTRMFESISKLLVDRFVDFPKDWCRRLEHLTRQQTSLVVDCLLAAGTISYSGGLSLHARDSVQALWIRRLSTAKLCAETKSFDLADWLIDSELGLERKQFELQGLPMDRLSVMNACIVTRCGKFPLVIDPHGVFTSWIQNKEKENSLMVVSLKEEKYLSKVRFAVQEGIPILVKDVNLKVPHALQSLSSRQIFVKKGRKSVFIGDMMVPYNETFRMYMVTRDECPDFSPQYAMWTTLVDFNLSQAGFQECILRGLVADKLESVHIYEKNCLENYVKTAAELLNLDLKHFFSSSTDVLVVDANLFQNILHVREDYENARQVAMDNLRKYRVASERTAMVHIVASPLSCLFDALWQVTPLHVSYQNVQNFFMTLVLMDLDNAHENEKIRSDVMRENAAVFEDLCAGYEDQENVRNVDLDKNQLEKELRELGVALTEALFFDLVRSIYEKDHLLFAFLVAVKTQMSKGLIYPEEFQHFLTNGEFRVPMGAEILGTERVEIDDDEKDTIVWEGFGRTGDRGVSQNPHPGYSWLSEKQWKCACRISSLKSIQRLHGRGGVASSITAYPEAWRKYMQAPNSEQAILALPHAFSVLLSPFQKLLLLRAFHPQYVIAGMAGVVQDWCGVDVSAIPPLEISAAYEDSCCTIPLLFILDPCTDPTEDIEEFAQNEFDVHDLRQLVTVQAIGSSIDGFDDSLAQCMKIGYWLLVRNAHMQISFQQKLEDAVTKIGSEDPHENFRLWITSLPINLSKDIYRTSLRVVWNAPMSVRAGMLRSYSSSPLIRDDFFNQTRTDDQDRMFKRCLFALCMTHAAIIERCAYGAVGWNFPPQVTAFDLKFCMLTIHNCVHAFKGVTVKDIRKAVLELVYTGNFTDFHDLETLKAILISFMPDSLIIHGLNYTEDGRYGMPEVMNLSDFGEYVVGLPNFAGSTLFGLEKYCDAVRFEDAANFHIRQLQDIYFLCPLEIQEDKGRGLERLDGVFRAEGTRAEVLSLLKLIPPVFDLEIAKSKHPISREEHRNRVLLQELEARNRLLNVMTVSLTNLLNCIDGEDSVTIEMEQMVISIYYQRVPGCWMKFSSLSIKPLGAYLEQLKESMNFYHRWLTMGLFETSLWLPAFFFPNLLLTAASLNFAEHTRTGIESVSFSFEILDRDPINISVNAGVYLTGLGLTGACWDFASCELWPLGSRTNDDLNGSMGYSSHHASTGSSSAKTRGDAGSSRLEESFWWSVPVLHVQPFRTDTQAKQPSKRETSLSRPESQMSKVSEQSASLTEGRKGLSFLLPPPTPPLLSDSPGCRLFSCPMYRTKLRKNVDSSMTLPNASSGFIINVLLPCSAPLYAMNDPQRFYVRRGTALIIDPDS